jgi:hypothetical protein
VNPFIYVVRLPSYRKTFYLLYYKRGTWLWNVGVIYLKSCDHRCTTDHVEYTFQLSIGRGLYIWSILGCVHMNS